MEPDQTPNEAEAIVQASEPTTTEAAVSTETSAAPVIIAEETADAPSEPTDASEASTVPEPPTA